MTETIRAVYPYGLVCPECQAPAYQTCRAIPARDLQFAFPGAARAPVFRIVAVST